MYTTKPLSHYRDCPEALELLPEGPNSGHLVLQGQKTITTSFFCFFKNTKTINNWLIKDLPFPQNKRLSIIGSGHNHSIHDVYLIPIINQPLSSNRYYAIKAGGRRRGEAYTSSVKEDICCFSCIIDLNPTRPFDQDDECQQFEFSVTESDYGTYMPTAKPVAGNGCRPPRILYLRLNMESNTPENFHIGEAQGIDTSLRAHLPDFNILCSQECSKSVVVGNWYCPVKKQMGVTSMTLILNFLEICKSIVFLHFCMILNNNKLLAKSVAPEGIPPFFLCREGWQMTAIPQNNFTLGEAQGVNSSLRTQLPDFSFPTFQECSKSVVVGKWYCPFMFIKEGKEKDQFKKSVFYEMTLEQRWVRIFSADKSHTHGKVVEVDIMVPTELIRISGQETVQEEMHDDDRRVVWFKNTDGRGKKEKVGMSSLIVERMMWEEERVGWNTEKEKHTRVVKEEEYEGIKDWKRYGCYVLVETFVLKRNDGSIVLTYEFKHTHRLRSKWE